MTDIAADTISALSLAASGIALWKATARDRRDQQAVIIARPVWERMGDDAAYYSLENVPKHDRPVTPDLQFVIDTFPGKALIDGVTLRKASPREDADREGWFSHHRIIKVENAGRWPAADCNITSDLSASFFVQGADFETETRTFTTTLPLGGISAGGHIYAEIRNLLGTPVLVKFSAAKCGTDGKQPCEVDAKEIFFIGRGPWSYLPPTTARAA